LHAVCEFHEALAEELGVVLICEGEAEIQADPLLLRRALTNVLSNALRHTPRGGSVRLSAAQPQAHQAVITVADTGCGIADAHLARVFDRFYRAPGALERSPGGAGLGLAIVESIMSLHEGSVTIRSSPGCGTSVELNFPGATDVCRYA
jgi:two-component system heavy metal sensor histidine kinase CusS